MNLEFGDFSIKLSGWFVVIIFIPVAAFCLGLFISSMQDKPTVEPTANTANPYCCHCEAHHEPKPVEGTN